MKKLPKKIWVFHFNNKTELFETDESTANEIILRLEEDEDFSIYVRAITQEETL